MRDTIGQYFTQPRPHSEVVDPNKVTPPPKLSHPASIPFEPAPKLRSPDPIHPLEPAPPLSVPAKIPFEPAPPLSVTASIPFEPAPPLSVTSTVPFMPAPPLSVPAAVPFEPPPALSVTSALPAMPAPPLSQPEAPPTMPAPPLTAPRQIGFQPPPTLTQPDPVAGPIVVGVDRKLHSDLVLAAEAAHNTIPGMVGDIAQDALAAAESITVKLPFGIELSPHGLTVPLIDMRQAVRGAADRAIQYGKAKAEAAIQHKVDSVIASAGIPFISSRVVPGVPSTTPGSLTAPPQQDFRIATGTSEPTPTELPDLAMDRYDPEMPYARDAREAAQSKQVEQAAFGDKLLSLNGRTDTSKLSDLFRENGSDNARALMKSLNLAPGSDHSLSVGFTSREGRAERRGYFPVTASHADARDNALPTDDEAYVPLVFTDLRPMKGGVYRTVYFRPFIKSLSENLAPQWSMQSYYGRVDKVVTYGGTDRQIQLAFKLVAFAPTDLQVMYQKLGWLSSMCYPQYQGGVYYRGPVVRMRVGDVINAIGREGNRGLPGVITSLDINYDDTTWELAQDMKLPRYIDVSLGFHVLHEHPIGLVAGVGGSEDTVFGGISSGGSIGKKNAKVDMGRFRSSFGSTDYLNDPHVQAVSPPAPESLASVEEDDEEEGS